MLATLRRVLASILPSKGEVWTFGVGSLLSFLTLAGYRIFIAKALVTKLSPADAWFIQLGDWEFWTWWGFGWWLGFRLFGRFLRLPFRIVFHVVSGVLTILHALDLAFFQVTGGRSDWDMLEYGLKDLSRIWPVINSEMTPQRWGIVAAVLVTSLLPLLRRWPEGGASWRSLVWIACFGPIIHMETQGRPKPESKIKPLQRGFVETLIWDAYDNIGDVETPPDPADLIPVEVAQKPDAAHPNVVMVLLESVGAAATTPYNDKLETTPNLAKYAAEGLKVDRMFAVVPHTSKALVTTMCGDWPFLAADIREARPGGLPGRCLGELMESAGYRTGFFQPAREDFEDRVDMIHNMGFKTFRPRALLEGAGFEKNNYFGIDDRSMLVPGLEWAQQDPTRPFFQAYLTLTSHHDYTVPSHWKTKEWPGEKETRRAKYYAAVNYVDDFLGRLIESYREAGLLENTVFLILGDHGEGFGEHGRYQHDLVIYEEGLRIPMVVYGPAVLQRTGVIDGERQQIDILPTVLELAGLEVTAGHPRGRSLLGTAVERVLYHSCWRAHRCLARRDGEDKYIDLFRDASAQRFNVVKDPKEKKDLSGDTERSQMADWRKEVRAWRGQVLGRYSATIAAWRARVDAPDDGSEALATWGERVSLLGCTTDQDTALPGEVVWVTCRWRAETELSEAIRLTTKAQAGRSKKEETWVPGQGELPVWEWKPGTVVTDTFRIHMPSTSAAGKAKIYVGWERYSGTDLEISEGVTQKVVATVDVLKRPKRAPGPSSKAAILDENDEGNAGDLTP